MTVGIGVKVDTKGVGEINASLVPKTPADFELVFDLYIAGTAIANVNTANTAIIQIQFLLMGQKYTT